MRAQRRTGGNDVKILGKWYSVYVARIVFCCARCYGKLVKVDFGLKCESDPDHRGFIHRNQVAEIEKRQQENVDKLKEIFEIKDGKVVLKNADSRTD